MSTFILIAIIGLLLVLRVNLVLIIMAAAGYVHMVWGAGYLEYFVQDIWAAMDREIILSIPLFILVGTLMARGSIAKRLVNLMIELSRPFPGGLAVATILSCAVFSALSGSSIVTMLAVGAVLYPSLLEHGYSRKFAIGALCAGGTLGIIIPPSVPMIIYGIISDSSIADLFLAGIGPGLLLTTAFTIYAMWSNRHLPRSAFDIKALGVAFKQSILALLMPTILLGGIYSGYFSPTEAAAVALLYALIIENLVYRELAFKAYVDITVDAGRLVGSLFPLIAVAVSMNLLITEHRIPHQLIELTLNHISNPMLFIGITNLILLGMGLFMDTASAILIATPLLKPIAEVYGFTATHLGIIMILNLEIGILTPPFGLNRIVAMTAFRESFSFISKAVIPWLIIMILCLILVTFNPWIALGILG